MAHKNNQKAVVLKKGKDKPILNRHHWIFSGAVKFLPKFENGDIMPVLSSDNVYLGQAYFNKRSSIIGRMISFDKASVKDTIRVNFKDAVDLRRSFFGEETNVYRLVNGEGDGLPGLVVDYYNGALVMQVSTLGMEKLKPFITDVLVEEINPRFIYERSKGSSRKEEGMDDVEGFIYGERDIRQIEVRENKVRFFVNIVQSQKTGFFIDQREMRALIGRFAKGRTMLNCFSYTGGFTVYALRGGALKVDSVDSSEEAIGLARENVRLNNYDINKNKFYVADVFEFLRSTRDEYDFYVVDPPAFAKRKSDVMKACRGYKDINRLVLERVLPRGLVLTCSCSYHVDESLFRKVIFQAAREAKRDVRIIQRHRLGLDHPLNIYHPEGEYLKGLLLYVS